MTQNWLQSQFSNVLIHLSAASTLQRSATTNDLEHWKMQEYVLIYQIGKKKFPPLLKFKMLEQLEKKGNKAMERIRLNLTSAKLE